MEINCNISVFITPPRLISDWLMTAPPAPLRTVHLSNLRPRFAKRKLTLTEQGNTERVRKRYTSALYESGQCSICMSRLPRGKDRYVTPCGHIYHRKCVENLAASETDIEHFYWLTVEQTVQKCPNCREAFIK
jgi:hypothetical protein